MRRLTLALLAILFAAGCGDNPSGIHLKPAGVQLDQGQNGTGILVSGLTLSLCQSDGQRFVQGTITVQNEGSVATAGLTLNPHVQYKPSRGPFQDLAGASQVIVPATQIAAGASETYPFSIPFTPVAGTKYRLAALVTITNHSGSLGTPKGPEPKGDLSTDNAVPCGETPPRNVPPQISITAPATGTAVTQGAQATFTGTASDFEDGNLTGSIAWSSNISGSLGTGASVSTTTLAVGTHTITASVTDTQGAQAQASITFVVNPIVVNTPPGVQITAPANNSSFTVGTNVTFTGTATDAEQGNLSASIAWASNVNGSLGTGASVSTTALSQGTHTITASVTDGGGLPGSASITVTINAVQPPPNPCATATPAGFTKSWIGDVSTDWASAGNWSPSGAPAATDNVFICAGRPNQPTLSVNTTINDLRVENTATLIVTESRVLTATGNVNAGTTIVGLGSVLMTGANKTFQGTFPNLIIGANGTIAAAAATTVVGNLLVRSPVGGIANLDVAGQTIHVTGAFETSGEGGVPTDNFARFTMDGNADVLDIDGNVNLFGGNSAGLLTAGALRVGGNFTAGCGNSWEFLPSGTHQVVFDGTSLQTVSLCVLNAPTQNHLFNVQVTNAAGANFQGVIIAGNLTVSTGASAIFEGPFNTLTRISGNVTSSAGSSLSGAAGFAIGGVLSVSGSYAVATTVFAGVGTQNIPVVTYQNVEVRTNGNAMLTGATTIAGNLTIANPPGGSANLTLNGNTLHVTGNFTTLAGTFTMTSASDVLDVDGIVSLSEGNSIGKLTAGVMRVAGSFTAGCGTFTEFVPSGTHRVVLDGTSAQLVSLCGSTSAVDRNRFFDLTVSNSAGVSYQVSTLVAHDLLLTGSMTVNAGITLNVTNTITVQSGGTLTNGGTINAGTCLKNAGGTVTNTGTINCGSGSL